MTNYQFTAVFDNGNELFGSGPNIDDVIARIEDSHPLSEVSELRITKLTILGSEKEDE